MSFESDILGTHSHQERGR